MTDPCPRCAGAGWVIAASSTDPGPLTADLTPCPEPDCPATGRPIAALGLRGMFSRAAVHPQTRAVLAVTGHRPAIDSLSPAPEVH